MALVKVQICENGKNMRRQNKMGRHQLKNEELTLEVVSHGAEMKSLKDNMTGQEFLWCGDSTYWGRTSPILFPLVGNYKEKKTVFEGKNYHLSQHGFARDQEFALVSQKDDEIWFELTDTEDTLENYPFHFRLSLGYRLEGRKVHVLWKVENTDTRKMYFSIGGHPAFNCPMSEGEKQTDYKIVYDAEGPLVCSMLDENGAVIKEKKELVLEKNRMQITEHLFDADALVIEHHQAHKVGLENPQGKVYVEVEFDAPLFGVWSPAGKHAPFVCIEPWYGRSDRAEFNQKLEEREWGNELEPGEIFEKSYKICV